MALMAKVGWAERIWSGPKRDDDKPKAQPPSSGPVYDPFYDGVDEEKAVDVVLDPGEFSIHHEAVVHGSNPNNANHPRIGISIHYIAPNVHQVLLKNATATLVRGADRHGHWAEDPEPKEDFDPICLKALDATYGEYLTGAGKY